MVAERNVNTTDKGTLYIDPYSDKEKYPVFCGMYDENDPGYTRACIDVYVDRFSMLIEEAEEDGDEAEKQKLLAEIEKVRQIADYVEIRP